MLSTAQYKNLLKAINLASHAGKCVWLTSKSGKLYPSCVVAHLAILEGWSNSELSDWVFGEYFEDQGVMPPILESYPQDLLKNIVTMWDAYPPNDDDLAKTELSKFVEKAFYEQE